MMYRVAPAIVGAIGIPFVHIVDVTAEAASAHGARLLGVVGSRAVMEPGFYWEGFRNHGIELLPHQTRSRPWSSR
jgi:aspartate racemase